MKLSKIDLSSLRAIAHDDNGLKLLIERENTIDCVEIPAPLAAYEGLQLLDRIISQPAIEPSEPAPARRLTQIDVLPVCSSMAAQVAYDYEREILQIEFNSGSVYEYSHVEPELWEDLQSTDSIGSFYNHEIKGYYPATRVE
jgi:KTSC domain